MKISEASNHFLAALRPGAILSDMVDAVLISRVKTLSVAERLELIGAVWETLSGTDVPVSEEEKALLDARLADAAENPEDESPWAEVQARLRKQRP